MTPAGHQRQLRALSPPRDPRPRSQGAASSAVRSDYSAIAAAEPDLILVVYSGITDQEYALLSDIAPTVAYPDEAWATPWRDTISIVGQALGKEDEAVDLLQAIADQVSAQAAAHPDLAGKSVALVWDSAGTFYVYKPADAGVEFLFELGMVSPESVDALSTDESTFYFTMSYEQLDELTSDVLVNFADTEEAAHAFLDAEYAQPMTQVQRGTVAQMFGPEFVASVPPPTALSLTWSLDEYVAILSEAAQAAG